MNRRGFIGAIAAAVAGAALDPERALWVPKRKLISIPSPPRMVQVQFNGNRYDYAYAAQMTPSQLQEFMATALANPHWMLEEFKPDFINLSMRNVPLFRTEDHPYKLMGELEQRMLCGTVVHAEHGSFRTFERAPLKPVGVRLAETIEQLGLSLSAG